MGACRTNVTVRAESTHLSKSRRPSNGTDRPHGSSDPNSDGSLAGSRVLVLSESKNDRRLLAQFLQHAGAEVDTLEPVAGSFQLDFPLSGDIVVIDADHPAGRTALDRVSTAPERPRILVLSSSPAEVSDPEVRADAILAKPVMHPDALTGALGALPMRCAQPAPSGAGLPTPEIRGSSLDNLLRIAGLETAVELLNQLAKDLNAVRSGLEQATADRDIATIREQTHILISLAGTVGADRLQDLAERFNRAAHDRDMGAIADLSSSTDEGLSRLVRELRGVRQGFVETDSQ